MIHVVFVSYYNIVVFVVLFCSVLFSPPPLVCVMALLCFQKHIKPKPLHTIKFVPETEMLF